MYDYPVMSRFNFYYTKDNFHCPGGLQLSHPQVIMAIRHIIRNNNGKAQNDAKEV